MYAGETKILSPQEFQCWLELKRTCPNNSGVAILTGKSGEKISVPLSDLEPYYDIIVDWHHKQGETK